MSDEQHGDLDPDDREMTSADLTAHDDEHGQVGSEEPSQQGHHDPETREDTASGGAPD